MLCLICAFPVIVVCFNYSFVSIYGFELCGKVVIKTFILLCISLRLSSHLGLSAAFVSLLCFHPICKRFMIDKCTVHEIPPLFYYHHKVTLILLATFHSAISQLVETKPAARLSCLHPPMSVMPLRYPHQSR